MKALLFIFISSLLIFSTLGATTYQEEGAAEEPLVAEAPAEAAAEEQSAEAPLEAAAEEQSVTEQLENTAEAPQEAWEEPTLEAAEAPQEEQSEAAPEELYYTTQVEEAPQEAAPEEELYYTTQVEEAPQEEAAQEEAAQEEAPQEEAAQEEAAQEEAPQEEAAQEEAAQEEAAQEEAPQEEATQEEAAQEEASQEEAAQEEAPAPEPEVDLPASIDRENYRFVQQVFENVGVPEASDPRFVIDVLVYLQQRFAGGLTSENAPEYTDLNQQDFDDLTAGVQGNGALRLPFTPPGLDFTSDNNHGSPAQPAAFTPFTEFIQMRFRESGLELCSI